MKTPVLKAFVLGAAMFVPFFLSGCAPECVDMFDCGAKAKAAGEEFTCVSGVCKPGSPFPDADAGSGSMGGGGGGATGGGGGATGGGGGAIGGGGGATGGGGGATGGGGGATGGGGGMTTPTVVSNTPLHLATRVSVGSVPSATFSEAMNASTLTTGFTLTSGASVPVPGLVSYANSRAQYQPTNLLAASTLFTATVTTSAMSANSVPLALNHTWTFTTGFPRALPVNLGSSINYVILAKTGISSVPASIVTGHIAVSPAAATFITGFSLAAPPTTSTTSPQVTGLVYAADFDEPTPTNLTVAVLAMEAGLTDANSRAADVTGLGAGNISGMDLASGVYQWGTDLDILTNLTLTGSATDVWIFQIAQNLTVANGVNIILAGGALPKNIFWAVSGAATLGTTAHFEGVILSQTAITMNTGASINGRLLAQSAVNLQSTTVVQPAP